LFGALVREFPELRPMMVGLVRNTCA
jgi:hypothetical protein